MKNPRCITHVGLASLAQSTLDLDLLQVQIQCAEKHKESFLTLPMAAKATKRRKIQHRRRYLTTAHCHMCTMHVVSSDRPMSRARARRANRLFNVIRPTPSPEFSFRANSSFHVIHPNILVGRIALFTLLARKYACE